jgi:hypothetical protein
MSREYRALYTRCTHAYTTHEYCADAPSAAEWDAKPPAAATALSLAQCGLGACVAAAPTATTAAPVATLAAMVVVMVRGRSGAVRCASGFLRCVRVVGGAGAVDFWGEVCGLKGCAGSGEGGCE